MKKILAIVMILAVIAAMVIPLAVSAADTVISGNVTATVELVAPAGFNLGAMAPKDAAYTFDDTVANGGAPGSVITNNAIGCNVTVKSDQTDGKMYNSTNPLTDALQVATGNGSGFFVTGPVTTTAMTCVVTGGLGTTPIPLSVSQKIENLDPVANYGITLTYTAGLNVPPGP